MMDRSGILAGRMRGEGREGEGESWEGGYPGHAVGDGGGVGEGCEAKELDGTDAKNA